MYLTYLDIFKFLSKDLNCTLIAEKGTIYIYTDNSELNVEIISGCLKGLLFSQDYNRTVEIVNDKLIKMY